MSSYLITIFCCVSNRKLRPEEKSKFFIHDGFCAFLFSSFDLFKRHVAKTDGQLPCGLENQIMFYLDNVLLMRLFINYLNFFMQIYHLRYLMIFHCLFVIQNFTWRIFSTGLRSRSTKLMKMLIRILTFIMAYSYNILYIWEHITTLRYLSNEFAWASLIIETVTIGGDMWTWSFVPTSKRTVAENRVFVFKTWKCRKKGLGIIIYAK